MAIAEEGLDGRSLAKAVTIDGRIEWYCRFCSETNVWTRSKCRRCQTTHSVSCKTNTCKLCQPPVVEAGRNRQHQLECVDQVLAHKAQVGYTDRIARIA